VSTGRVYASARTEIRHGTEYGYRQHRARGEDACEACRSANVLATRIRQGKTSGPSGKAMAAPGSQVAQPMLGYLRNKLSLARREAAQLAGDYADVLDRCERAVLSHLVESLPGTVLADRAWKAAQTAVYGLCTRDWSDAPDRLCDNNADGRDGLGSPPGTRPAGRKTTNRNRPTRCRGCRWRGRSSTRPCRRRRCARTSCTVPTWRRCAPCCRGSRTATSLTSSVLTPVRGSAARRRPGSQDTGAGPSCVAGSAVEQRCGQARAD
jgi:hypothetical protein